jgi:hypothetical protein
MKGTYYFGFKFLSVGNIPADEVEGLPEAGEAERPGFEIMVVDHFEKPSEN